MYKLIFFIFFFTVTQWNVFCQNPQNTKSILVFSSEPGFLRPYIETTIKELKDTNLDKLFFDEVYSLNNLDEDIEIRSTISKILWSQENATSLVSSKPLEEQDIEFQDQVIKKLTSYDYFLAIKTNTLGELIEFQFQLFDTVEIEMEYGKKTYLKRVLVDNVVAVENFFINPKDSKYLTIVKNAIFRLFKGSNKMPIARLKIYGQNIKNNDTVLVPIDTPIQIDGSLSFDIDTEEISYHWKNIPKPNENFQTFDKLELIFGEPKQNLIVKKDGVYLIRFKVNDGILDSKEINVYLKSTHRQEPPAFLSNEITHYSYASLKHPNPIVNGTVSYELKAQENKNIKMLIMDKEIGEKYVEAIHENNKIDYKYIDSYVDERKLVQKVSVESNFKNFPSDSINYFYAYSMDKDSILSEYKLLKHNYIHRKLGTFSTIFSSTIVQGYDLLETTPAGDTIRSGNSSFAISLEGSIYISPRIELGGSFPVYSKGRADFGKFSLKPHSSLSLFTNYYIIPKSDSYLEFYLGIGGGVSDYRINGVEDSFEVVYLQEARFGAQLETTFFRKFSMSYGFRFIAGRYNKSIFKDLYYIDMGLLVKFRV